MEIKAHDLIQIRSDNDLIYHTTEPDWVDGSIKRAPFVVVRRAHSEGNCIPIGIRGINRDERYAAFVNVNDIVDIYTPEKIVQARDWIHCDKKIFTYLEQIETLMDGKNIDWGPVGSVGFELVSKVPTVNDKSDIDIIIRYASQLTLELAREIINKLKRLPIPTDVQVETLKGSFSLQEYAFSKGEPILFKTKNGPLLKSVSKKE